MRRLFLIVLLSVIAWHGMAEAITIYQLANNFDEAGVWLSRRAERVQTTKGGVVALLGDRNAGSEGLYLYTTVDKGATITPHTGLYNTDTKEQSSLSVIEDSLYISPTFETSSNLCRLIKFTGAVRDTADTVGQNSAPITGGNRDGFGAFLPGSNTYLAVHDSDATTDQSVIYQSDGPIKNTAVWTTRAQKNVISGAGGLRLALNNIKNVKALIAAWELSNKDLQIADTTGWHTLITDVVATDLNTPGLGASWWTFPVDSFGAFSYQPGLTGTKGLFTRTGYMTSGASGSPTAFNWLGSAVEIVSSANTPDNWRFCPFHIFVRGRADSMWVGYRFPNGANVDVMVAFSSDSGRTFGTPTVLIAGSSSTSRYWYCQASKHAVWKDGVLIRAGSFSDSAATGSAANEYAYLWIDTSIAASEAPPDPDPDPPKNRLMIRGRAGLDDESADHFDRFSYAIACYVNSDEEYLR